MFPWKEKSANNNVHLFHKLLEAAIQWTAIRRVLVESNPEKIRKIHKETSIVESSLCLVQLQA